MPPGRAKAPAQVHAGPSTAAPPAEGRPAPLVPSAQMTAKVLFYRKKKAEWDKKAKAYR